MDDYVRKQLHPDALSAALDRWTTGQQTEKAAQAAPQVSSALVEPASAPAHGAAKAAPRPIAQQRASALIGPGRLNELEVRFVRDLRQQRDQLAGALGALSRRQGDASALNDLRQLAHLLAGTAGMFGFSTINDIAEDLEAAVTKTPERHDVISSAGSALLSAVDQVVERR